MTCLIHTPCYMNTASQKNYITGNQSKLIIVVIISSYYLITESNYKGIIVWMNACTTEEPLVIPLSN